MQRTSAPGATSENQFTEGDASQGVAASVVGANWLNAIQEELAGTVEGFDYDLDPQDNGQLLKILQGIVDSIPQAILDAEKQRWRVGSIYINATDGTNPSVFFGFGEWRLVAQGRGIFGYDAYDYANNFRPIGKTGGARTVSLTGDQNGPHTHGVPASSYSGTDPQPWVRKDSGQEQGPVNTTSSGNGAPHENLPPYVVMYIWQRTA